MDLTAEQPDLKIGSAASMVDVTIDSVTFEIDDNTLNIATPQLTIYVAPSSVTMPGAGAQAIATIDSINASATTNGPVEVDFTDTGKAALSQALSTYQTPFNVLIGSSVTLAGGDPVPTGKLDAIVHIDAHASE